MSADARAKALSALTRFQVAESTLGETLHRITEITLEAIPTAAVAGITMLDADGRPTTAVYTDPLSEKVDAAQYSDGVGPCLDAWRQRRIFSVPNMDAATAQYPAFAEASRNHGILSTLSLPMISAEDSVGALNLYAHRREAFDANDESVAEELALAASFVLANVSAYQSAAELSQNLKEAMASRAVIEQAKGILMGQSPELTADDAFDVLRQASQRENVKLRDIAQRIVGRRQSSGTSMEHPDNDV